MNAESDRQDLSIEACVLEVDGVADAVTGARVEGLPAEVLGRAINALVAGNLAIGVGRIVRTGGLADSVTGAVATRVAARFTDLGPVGVDAGTHGDLAER